MLMAKLCTQGNVEDPSDAMARIFVWLRYSASRQLTWQRNYNTQPRILGSAQERLTHKMAEVTLLSLPGEACITISVYALCNCMGGMLIGGLPGHEQATNTDVPSYHCWLLSYLVSDTED